MTPTPTTSLTSPPGRRNLPRLCFAMLVLMLVLAALVLLLFALRDALAALIGQDGPAALIVALPFLAAAAILTFLGVRRMSPRSPEA